jgi:hypothetical protein
MKKTTKKLTLRSETLRKIGAEKLDQVVGGSVTTCTITLACPVTRLGCHYTGVAC